MKKFVFVVSKAILQLNPVSGPETEKEVRMPRDNTMFGREGPDIRYCYIRHPD